MILHLNDVTNEVEFHYEGVSTISISPAHRCPVIWPVFRKVQKPASGEAQWFCI